MMTTFPFDHLPVHGAEAPKLSALRDAGRAAFTAMGGLPGARVEDFKYTPLAKLGEFRPREPHAVDRIPASVPDFPAVRLVLVNGRLDARLSDLDALPKGVSIAAMADAVKDGAVLAMLGSTLPDQGLPMAGLNAARFRDGVAITIAAGAALELPLHLISITGAGAGIDPRHLVSLGENAEATLVETHVSVGEGLLAINAVTELLLAPSARLKHRVLFAEGADATHIATTGIDVADKAVYDGVSLSLGLGLMRNEMRVTLSGAHAEARLHGAYVGRDTAHIDTTTFIDHARPDCLSRQVFKGVLGDRSRGVFQGKVLVRPEAQRTDGHQLHKALMLSDKAEVDCKPELEIYADDVKCSHGATIGEIDLDQLFYLRARGIDEATARGLLVAAFVTETLDAIGEGALRDAFAARLDTVLGGALR